MAKKIILKKKKTRKVKCVATLAICMVSAIYFTSSVIVSTYTTVCDAALRYVGFTVNDINIVGASQKTSALIMGNLGINRRDSIFKLSTPQIYNNVTAVTWVKSAIAQKNLPNIISIKVVEKVPMAVFQRDRVFTLIDKDGEFIEDVLSNPGNLPVAFGENANVKAAGLINTLSKFEALNGKVEAIKLIRDRRWDIVVSGLLVKLPEQDVEQAIEKLARIVQQGNVNKNTATCIDFRARDRTVINGLKLRSTGKQNV
jgi:cell division protein FtsQ